MGGDGATPMALLGQDIGVVCCCCCCCVSISSYVCKNNILRCECCRWRDSEDPRAQTRDNNKKSRLLACKQQLATRWESRGARGVIDPIPFASSHFAPGAPEREKKKKLYFFSFLV